MKDGVLVWFTRTVWFEGSDNFAFERSQLERFAFGNAKVCSNAARTPASEASEMNNII